jgi:hypothetical protein
MPDLRRLLSAGAGILIASALHAHLEPVKEAEPNDTPAIATAMTTTTSCFAAVGAIATAGDIDYFSVKVPSGGRLWAMVDTGRSTASRDSLLTLFAPDGTTRIDQDDNGALASGCDVGIESRLASAIAGKALSAGGTYLLRVQAPDPGSLITHYMLFVVITSTTAPEIEPNDSSAKATPIVTSESPIGVRRGSIRAGDADLYSVATMPGSVLSVSLVPDAGGARSALAADLLQANGTVLLSTDGGPAASAPSPTSFCFIRHDRSTEFIQVRGTTSARGAPPAGYTLLVAACGMHDEAAGQGSSPSPTPRPRSK